MADALRLYGMKAVVTGAASGIGEAIVRTLVKQGAEVLAVDSANSPITTQFKSLRSVHSAAQDLLAPDAAAKLGELAGNELGVIDIVVCNFSFPVEPEVGDAGSEAFARLLKRKNELVRNACDQLMTMMKNTPAGRIIILGFNRSVFGPDGEQAYAKSQASIADVTAELAAEGAPFGINVNYIQPGAIMTPDSRRIFNGDKAFRDQCIRRSAARRLGEPVDIAKVALFLATDDSVFVSGTGVIVDGGAAKH